MLADKIANEASQCQEHASTEILMTSERNPLRIWQLPMKLEGCMWMT
jgi:hypothetical protein